MREPRARLGNGRLVLDEPTTLPEGIVIDLVAHDKGDDLKAFELLRRHANPYGAMRVSPGKYER